MARRKSPADSIQVKHAMAERLRALRAELFGDHGGPELARRLGLPIRTWYNYETGVTIRPDVMLKFIELTSVEPTWLLHGVGPKFRTSLPGQSASIAKVEAADETIVQGPDDEQILAAMAKQLSRLVSAQQSEEKVIGALREVIESLRSEALTPPDEAVLESFEGFVDEVEGDIAYVRLKSREHGDTLYGKYPMSQLLEQGIKEQGRFLCKTVKVDGKTRVDMQAIPGVPATCEQLRAIEEKIDRVLPRVDPGIEY